MVKPMTTTFEIRGWEAEVRTVPSRHPYPSKMFPTQKDIFVRRAGSDLPATCIVEDHLNVLWDAGTIVSRYVDALERFSVSIEKRLQQLDPNAPEAEKQGLLSAAQTLLEGSLAHYHLSFGLVVGQKIENFDFLQGKDIWRERAYKAGDEAVCDVRHTYVTLLNNHSSNTTEWFFGTLHKIHPFFLYFNDNLAPPWAIPGAWPWVKVLTPADEFRRNQNPVEGYSRKPETTHYWRTPNGDMMRRI